MFDQMTMAARSVTANIAEGLSRHQTSRETELKLLDVATASLSELFNDYYTICLDNNYELWERNSEIERQFDNLKIPQPAYVKDWDKESMELLKQLLLNFQPWCEHANGVIEINSKMHLILRLKMMLQAKMNALIDEFRTQGGFTEAMTRERLDARRIKAQQSDAPLCPLCNSSMLRRIVKKGERQGKEFWSCSNFPQCRGTRSINEK